MFLVKSQNKTKKEERCSWGAESASLSGETNQAGLKRSTVAATKKSEFKQSDKSSEQRWTVRSHCCLFVLHENMDNKASVSARCVRVCVRLFEVRVNKSLHTSRNYLCITL